MIPSYPQFGYLRDGMKESILLFPKNHCNYDALTGAGKDPPAVCR